MAFSCLSSDAKYYGLGEEAITVKTEPGATIAVAVEVTGGDAEGAVGPIEVNFQKGNADCKSLNDERSGQEMAEGAKADEVPQKPRRNRPRIQYKFLPWQVQELEKVFEETQYPDVLRRRALSRRVYVAETKLQAWFKNRRAKHRKMLKDRMYTEVRPTTQDLLA